MRDSSLKVPPGVKGIVIDARVFCRKGQDKDQRALEIEDQERARIERTRDEEINAIKNLQQWEQRKRLAPRRRAFSKGDESSDEEEE